MSHAHNTCKNSVGITRLQTLQLANPERINLHQKSKIHKLAFTSLPFSTKDRILNFPFCGNSPLQTVYIHATRLVGQSTDGNEWWRWWYREKAVQLPIIHARNRSTVTRESEPRSCALIRWTGSKGIRCSACCRAYREGESQARFLISDYDFSSLPEELVYVWWLHLTFLLHF